MNSCLSCLSVVCYHLLCSALSADGTRVNIAWGPGAEDAEMLAKRKTKPGKIATVVSMWFCFPVVVLIAHFADIRDCEDDYDEMGKQLM
jgi:hypothetical protein